MYRILLAEEQPAMREAVRARLEKAGYEVIQDVTDGTTALRQTLDLKPDLLVLSLRLKRMGGLEVLRRLSQHGASTKTLVMTAADSEHVVGMCMKAGATGFVSKAEDLSELTLAVQAISRNHTFFPSSTGARGKSDAHMLSEIEQIASLSPREVTVLSYLADGHSNRDICEFLSLNSRTVSTYKLRLFRKLNIKSLVELAEVARRNHILGRAVATQHAGDATWPIADDGYKTLRKVLDAVPSGLCVRDLAGKLLFANKFLLSRLEKEEGEVLGTELTELEGLESKQAALLQAQYLDAAQRGSPFETEIMLRFRREHRPVLYWGSPVADGAGVTKAFICGVQNVQGQELLFLQLRAEKERAEAASAAKSLLLIEHAEGMVNQIEQLTQALAPLMEGGRRTAVDRRCVADAFEAAHALASQVGGLQTLIATNRAAVQPLREQSHVSMLLRELIEVLETRYSAREARINFDDSQMDVDEVWLDAHRFRQVLSSLLSQRLVNAKKPVLDVTLRTEARSRALVFVEIEWADVSGSRKTRAAPPLQFGMQVGIALAESLGAELILLSPEPMRVLLRFIAPRAKVTRTDA